MKTLSECVKETIAINEMAESIKNFKRKTKGEIEELIIHICLCFYSKLYLNERCYDHWLGECITFSINITDYKLKSGNLGKVIASTLRDKNFSDKKEILHFAKSKFKKEGITKDIQDILVDLYVSHIDELIEILIKATEDNISKYLNNYIFDITKHSYEIE